MDPHMHYMRSCNTSCTERAVAVHGPHWPAEHFLRATYHQIWPPITYAEVNCHIAAEIVL